MGTLVFKVTDDLKKMIEHSKKHPCCVAYTKKKSPPSLYLVHDQGVYLMSAATVPLPNEKKDKPAGVMNLVVYAQGCDPVKNEDCHENSNALVGGDDFAENVEVSMIEKIIDQKYTCFAIELTETQMKVYTTKSARKGAHAKK